MYGGGGNCQVMSSIGGNNVVTSPDSLFSSSPMGNPNNNNNLNFMTNMPFNPFSSIIPKEEVLGLRSKEEEVMESGSGSGHLDGGASIDEQEDEQINKPKKKRYHRHTARQIQEMESLFKECPHPDDKQRMRLSQELGLKPRQVKFWFQNRRTQMKAQQDRTDNVILRAENENLKNDNYRLQAALRNVICPSCGGPAILGEMSFDEQHLRLENARLRDELERLSCITQRYNIRPIQTLGHSPHLLPSLDLDMGIYSRHFQEPTGSCTDLMAMPENQEHDLQLTAGCCLILEQEKPLAMELAMNAMDELIKMCQATEPLWIRCNNGNKEVLNLEEHARLFPWPMNLKQFDENEFRREATRDSAVVIMNSITLVDAFLDANKWMDLFPSIVSRARTVQIITSGLTDHACGSLHLMHAEFQVLSPLVPTREVYFLRYCQQNVEAGIWAIVDFPVDSFQDTTHLLTSSLRYRRRPSGCIIQDMPNGYSRVIWVEHSEVEDKPIHQIFNQFVSSGQAFGAQRWLSVLQQQCERFASLMARNISDLGVIPSPEARKNLMKLAHRILKTFCFNISSSGGQSWTALQDSSIDTVRITTRKNVEPGQPNGMILAGVTTTWLPFSHHQVFDFLRDEHKRSQLDVLSGGTSSQEVAHIANGAHPGNCISLLRINAASNSAQNVELMLQESCTDNTGSMVVYTTIDVDAVQLAMRGDDPSYIPISPAGFVITPVNNNTENGDNNNALSEGEENGGQTSGCLLTVGLQVLASTIPGAKLNLSSITAISNHICNAVHQINAVLSSIHKNNGNGSLLGGNAGEGGSCSEPTTTATAASEH